MTINVEVEKTGSETNASLLRRFSRRVQGAGIINKVKGGRYKDRSESKYKRKVRTLGGLVRRKNTERLIKLGKITPRS
jgi:ribosomal protein S21